MPPRMEPKIREVRALIAASGFADDIDIEVDGGIGAKTISELERWAGEALRIPVVASALQPLAGRFADGVPSGVHDLGVEVWSQPDAFVAFPEPADDDPAVAGTTQAELWGSAAAGDQLTDGDRLLSEANPASPSGLASLTEPLARSGSLVLAAHVSAERRERIAADDEEL